MIGSAPFGFWRRTDGPETWEFTGLDEAPFGARILADPAPAALDEPLAPALPLTIGVRPNPVVGRAEFMLAPIGSPVTPVAIEIYDLAGRVIDRLDAKAAAVTWTPPAGTARGMYFARVSGNGAPAAIAFVLLR